MSAGGIGSAGGSRRRRRLRRRVTTARNVAAAYAGTLGEGAVFLVLTPFLVRRLGLVEFGLWTLALALADWLALLDLGLRDAVLKHTAAHQARADAEAVSRLAGAALFLYILLALLALALTAAGAVLAPRLLAEPSAMAELGTALWVLGGAAALGLPAGLAGSLIEGMSRFDLANLFRLGQALARLVLMVLALQLDLGLTGLAAAEATARLGTHAARWLALHRLDPGLVPRPVPHRAELRRLFDFGLWSALRQANDVAWRRVYEPILALTSGLATVGAFHAARRLATIPAEAILPLVSVLFPLSSELEASGRSEGLRELLLKATKTATAVAVPVALVLGCGAHPIQTNWLGDRVPEAVPILEVFALVFLVVAATLPAEVFLLGIGRVRLLAVVGWIQIALLVGLGWLLVPALGPSGLAVATLAAVSLQLVVHLPIAARACGLPLARLVRRAFLAPALCAAPVAALLFHFRFHLAVGGLAGLAAFAMLGGTAYGLLLWRFGIDGEERAFLAHHAARLLQPPLE